MLSYGASDDGAYDQDAKAIGGDFGSRRGRLFRNDGARRGGILVSAKVCNEIEGKLEVAFDDRGERQLKNISKTVRTYALASNGSARPSAPVNNGAKAASGPSLPDKPSIAVLPFQNMSGDPEQEYFADGMVEDIITALSRFRSLFVIARNSSFTNKGKAADIKQVRRDLGVRYVLEGSVRKSSARVRITGQLIEAATGAHLWADRFDGQLEDTFDLQDSITERVVSSIAPTIRDVETKRARGAGEIGLRAYDCYWRALAAYNYPSFTAVHADEAIAFCKRAIELDPNFAAAYALAAQTTARKSSNGFAVDGETDATELCDSPTWRWS